MLFRSTRDSGLRASLEEAVFRGLAPDGGLYVPVEHPVLAGAADPEFVSVASAAGHALLGTELGPSASQTVAKSAFPFAPVLRRLDPGLFVLELFHGPSCAFKDFGASWLASLMDAYCERQSRRATVLVATSGDTGSAVAQAFRGRRNVRVVILYPRGRVTELQERQLTTVGHNVTALEVEGSFDDCQRMAKEAFRDEALVARHNLTSANSINVGRFLPQAFYYLWAAWALPRDGGVSTRPLFVVPSGNLGNLCAGLYAWRWGMDVSGFLAATNANDVLPRWLSSGRFEARVSVRTLSNAMDVGDPSNMERIRDLFSDDVSRAAPVLSGEAVTDAETLEGMREAYGRYGYIMDPHTAVGYVASGRRAADTGGPVRPSGTGPVVLLATAHPAKFIETVRSALGVEPEMPPALLEAQRGKKVSIRVPPTREGLAAYLDAG